MLPGKVSHAKGEPLDLTTTEQKNPAQNEAKTPVGMYFAVGSPTCRLTVTGCRGNC